MHACDAQSHHSLPIYIQQAVFKDRRVTFSHDQTTHWPSCWHRQLRLSQNLYPFVRDTHWLGALLRSVRLSSRLKSYTLLDQYGTATMAVVLNADSNLTHDRVALYHAFFPRRLPYVLV